MTIIVKDNDDILKIPKDLFIKNGSTNIDRVKELWIQDNGTLRRIYGGNITNYTGDHPYWRYSLNSEFRLSDGLVPCWNTFFSTNNAGGYSLSTGGSGTIQVQIPLAAMTQTEVPGSAGGYEYTTETRSIFCNYTAGTRNVITFNTGDLEPYGRTGVDGVTYRWNISDPGYLQSGSTINLVNPTSSIQFQINRNALLDGNGRIPSISRTYPSAVIPPTEGYTQYVGYCVLQSNYEIRISENTSYSIRVMPTAGTTGNTTWKIGCLTGSNGYGSAQFFAPGSSAFESSTYTTTTQERTLTFTSPSGANRARPYIRIDYDSGADGLATTLPRQYTFDYVRFS